MEHFLSSVSCFQFMTHLKLAQSLFHSLQRERERERERERDGVCENDEHSLKDSLLVCRHSP